MRRRCSESCPMGRLRSNRKIILLAAGAVCAVLAAGSVLAAIAVWVWTTPAPMPSCAKVREAYRTSDGILRDRHGVVIHEMRVDPTGRSLDWTALPEVSPTLTAAVVQSEDKRFYTHHGVDYAALGHAMLKNRVSGGRRGASTITMQLASLVERRLKAESGRRTWREKIRQIRAARMIERTWSKQQILEAYINLVSFRGELRGIAAASRGLFGKESGGLDRSESLILAVLVRSPNANPEKVAERVWALNIAMKTGLEKATLVAQTKETLLKPYALKARASLAPHVASYLLSGSKKDVTSTLDAGLQAFAAGLLDEQLSLLKGRNVTDGAIIVVENRTGEIRAYVGNGGAQSTAIWVDGVKARRQAGSTLKPFLYALAVDKQVLTAASLIEDSPVEVPTARGIYKPENYDNSFKGNVPARVALASSLNVPAVKVLMLAGVDDFTAKLNDLGFSDLRDGDYYGFSLALGTLDVSLFELTNAYRTLANGGTAGSLTLIPGQGSARTRRVYSRESAFIVSDILSDREARSLTFGYENSLATPFWAAAKTGTSKDMRDNWCVGWSGDFTVGVWIGNFSGSPMWNVSGVSGAAPIWHELMRYLAARTPGAKTAPAAPGRVVRVPVQTAGGAEKSEWFIKGTEPLKLEATPPAGGRPRIVYPPKNVIIALDPDIPAGTQKVFFEAAASGKQVAWVLDNVEVCKGDFCGWDPKAGAHTLKLVDEGHAVLDQVSFTVRD